MTYMLNVISLGLRETPHLQVGRLSAELDDPPTAFLQVKGQSLIGTRYLIVTDDGTGYTSSNELVRVPRHSEQSTIVSVPAVLADDLRRLLIGLMQLSPERRLAVYLEANRAVSREDPDDPYPVHLAVVEHVIFEELWDKITQERMEEDEIHIVG
jgi:hypothetical protein